MVQFKNDSANGIYWIRQPLRMTIIFFSTVFLTIIIGFVGMLWIDEFICLMFILGVIFVIVVVLTSTATSKKSRIIFDATGIKGCNAKQFQWDWTDIVLTNYKKDNLVFPIVLLSKMLRVRQKQYYQMVVSFVANGGKELKIELDKKRMTKIFQFCTNQALKNELVTALDKSWNSRP